MSLLQRMQRQGTQATAPRDPLWRRRWRLLRAYLSLHDLWNRDLPEQVEIRHQIVWPLWLLPIVLFNQIVTPHPIWLVLLVVLAGLYGVAIYWVRVQATTITMERRRLGATLVAGDQLEEEFVLHNHSPLPVIWAEVRDQSTIPDYRMGRVVACGSNTSYRWNAAVTCRHRGVYQLGPYHLRLADPIGLFTLTIAFTETDTVIIYPRVLRLPTVPMPEGSQSGTARRRRPLLGNQPSAAVRSYQPTDSLRHVHWPTTAHRGQLMVKEMESEPSGTVWVLLDLDQHVQQGVGEAGTLEYGIIVAASLTAELLQDDDRRAVGLFTISGTSSMPSVSTVALSPLESTATAAEETSVEDEQQPVIIPPQSGQAQLWHVLAGLAPVQPSTVALTDLLRSARASLGRRATVIIVTPYPANGAMHAEIPPWLAELVHLQGTGIHSSVIFVTAEEQTAAEDTVTPLLSRYGIPTQIMATSAQLPAALTFRRTRRVIRSTPTGGAISIEVEEEVG